MTVRGEILPGTGTAPRQRQAATLQALQQLLPQVFRILPRQLGLLQDGRHLLLFPQAFRMFCAARWEGKTEVACKYYSLCDHYDMSLNLLQ